MSFCRANTNTTRMTAQPTMPARSYTRVLMGLPRTFSSSANRMCPPSSGKIGSRLKMASTRLMSPMKRMISMNPSLAIWL